MSKEKMLKKEALEEKPCQIFGFIMKTSRVFDAILTRGLRQYDLSRTQFDVLINIYFNEEADSIKLSDLGKLLFVSKANITGVTTRLEERGLITRVVSNHDARSKELALTKAGTKMVEQVIPKYIRVVHDLIIDYSQKDQNTMHRVLGNLHNELLKNYESDSNS